MVSLKKERLDITIRLRRDENFKAAQLASLIDIQLYNILFNNEATYCKDVIVTIPIVMYTKKDFYLLNAINRKIQQIIEAGLVEFWFLERVNSSYYMKKEESSPEILNMDELSGGFAILYLGLIFSSIAFFIEIGFKLGKKFFWPTTS